MGGFSMRRWIKQVHDDPLNKSLYEVDANGRKTHWYPPHLWRRAALAWRQANPYVRPFVPPAAPANFSWATRFVAVVASFNGSVDQSFKKQRMHGTPTTLVVYQRSDPSREHYSPNFGFEGGVFVQFVLTYYDCLPNHTLFLQEHMAEHNPQWPEWAQCLLPTASWAPMSKARMQRSGVNGQSLDFTHAYDGIIEQCWRNLLAAFGRSEALPARTSRPSVGSVVYFGGGVSVASREQLRRHPRSAYAAAHRMLAGGDGRCVTEDLHWAELQASRSTSLPYDAPLGRGKHTSANAWEALHAVILGGLGLQDTTLFDVCDVYRHKNECKLSPCPDLAPAPAAVTHNYQSVRFAAALRAWRKRPLEGGKQRPGCNLTRDCPRAARDRPGALAEPGAEAGWPWPRGQTPARGSKAI